MINQRSIVDRLRHSAAVNRDGEEAADEIERLMRERDEAKTDAQKAHTHAVAECQDNDRLRAALERYPRDERRCHVGNDADGNVFEPFVRAAWADAEIARLTQELEQEKAAHRKTFSAYQYLTEQQAAARHESERQRCEEPDGCPTELAVLQRYWRAKHALLPPEGNGPYGPCEHEWKDVTNMETVKYGKRLQACTKCDATRVPSFPSRTSGEP